MDDLIQYVFANENDYYYRNDLLRLDLHQQLWFMLHEKYSCVYYLTADGNTFTISTFGDIGRSQFKEKKRIVLYKKQNGVSELGNWMKALLENKNAPVAFVCSSADFCQVCGGQEWRPILDKMATDKKRTGTIVLTVPVTVEDSKPFFLSNKSMFTCLGEKAVTDIQKTSGAPIEMYRYIKESKGNGCIFLNLYTRENIYPIVLKAMLAKGSRFLTDSELNGLVEYLTAYMNSAEIRCMSQLFTVEEPPEYMLFDDLFRELENDAVWEKAVENSRGFDVNRYSYSVPTVSLVRGRNTVFGELAMLRLPKGITSNCESENPQELLDEIRDELLKTKNTEDNPIIIKELKELCDELKHAEAFGLRTYTEILEAIRFCVYRVYKHFDKEEEKRVKAILGMYKSGIQLSKNICEIERNIELLEKSKNKGRASMQNIKNANNLRLAYMAAYTEIQDFLNASLFSFSEERFNEALSTLEVSLQCLKNSNREQEECGCPDIQQTEQQDSDKKYYLDFDDYISQPPKGF